jgi:hypothetical protein
MSEVKIPENYQEGGQSKLNKYMLENIPQLIFLLGLVVWAVASIWVTMSDIISGEFEHKALTVSFIIGSLSGGYLKTRHYLIKRKNNPTKKKENCKKCGKNKTKK